MVRADWQRGFVLLAVLGILMLTAGLVFTQVDEERFLRQQVDYVGRAEQARVMALSAVGPAKALLVGDARASRVDSLQERWAIPFSAPSPQGTVWVRIEDVQRRWNLNGLTTDQGVVNAGLLTLLQSALTQASVDDAVLGELIDWLDPDSQYSLVGRGRERDDYRVDGYPYGPRNGPMRTEAELRLLPSWSDAVAAALEPIAGVGAGCRARTLNINTASRAALAALENFWTPAQVDALLQARESEPFGSVEEALSRIGWVPDEAQKSKRSLLSVDSGCFEIQIVAEYEGVSTDLRLSLTRSLDAQQQPTVEVTYWQWMR